MFPIERWGGRDGGDPLELLDARRPGEDVGDLAALHLVDGDQCVRRVAEIVELRLASGALVIDRAGRVDLSLAGGVVDLRLAGERLGSRLYDVFGVVLG